MVRQSCHRVFFIVIPGCQESYRWLSGLHGAHRDSGHRFWRIPLFDGSYAMVFEMWATAGNYAYSDAVTFDCADGEIWTTVYED